MNPNARTIWQHVITGMKFIFFAIPGGFLTVFGLVMLIAELTSVPHPNRTKDMIAAPIAMIIGLPMTLFGVGQWGKWKYAYVFISIPIFLLIWGLFPIGGKFGVLFAAIPAFIVYRMVRNSYDRLA